MESLSRKLLSTENGFMRVQLNRLKPSPSLAELELI